MTQNMVEYLDTMVTLMRQANAKAREASIEWNAQNDALEEWMDRHGIMDPKSRAGVKTVNLPLQAAFSTWGFWRDESARYAATIQAEEAAAKMKDWFIRNA